MMSKNESFKNDAPKSKSEQERQLNKELEGTFPASDPPASTQPGGGITGPNNLESSFASEVERGFPTAQRNNGPKN
jgi:hypothetical protein